MLMLLIYGTFQRPLFGTPSNVCTGSLSPVKTTTVSYSLSFMTIQEEAGKECNGTEFV